MYLDHLKTRAELFSQEITPVEYSEILESSMNMRELESEFDMALLRMEYCQRMGSESFGGAVSAAAEKVKEIIIKLIEIAVSVLAKVKDFIVAVFKKIFELISSAISFITDGAVGGGSGNGLAEVQENFKKESDPGAKFKLVANYLKNIKLVNPKGSIYSFSTLDVDKIVDSGMEEISGNLENSQVNSLKRALKEMYKKERIDKSKVNKRITDDLQSFKNSCSSLASSAKKALKEIDTNTIKREAEQNPEETEKMGAYRAALNVTTRLNEFVGKISRDSLRVGNHARSVYQKMRMPKGATGDCEVVFFDFKHFFDDYIKPSFELVARAKDVTAQYVSSLKSSDGDFKGKREKYREDIVKLLHADFTKSISANSVGNEGGLSDFLHVAGLTSAITGAIVGGIMLVGHLCNAAIVADYGVEMSSGDMHRAEYNMDKIENLEKSIHEHAYVMVQMANLVDKSSFNENRDNPDNSKGQVSGSQVKDAIQQVMKDLSNYQKMLNDTTSSGKPLTSIPFKNSVERFSKAELDSLSNLVDDAQRAYFKAEQNINFIPRSYDGAKVRDGLGPWHY